jgi:glycosyltransferase involved in cell wall biosynthesis
MYGPQSHARVLDLMCGHAVLAVPSLLVENQPTVILEGLSCGCRIVASDVGGIPESLDGAGWIVKAGDANALASGLRLAIEDADPDEREKSRERIIARHRLEDVVADLESVLKSNL